MRVTTFLWPLALGGFVSACDHGHDGKEWTKEELAELEAKWGFEVCPNVARSPEIFQDANYCSGPLAGLELLECSPFLRQPCVCDKPRFQEGYIYTVFTAVDRRTHLLSHFPPTNSNWGE